MPSLAQTTTLQHLRDSTRPLLIFADAKSTLARRQVDDLKPYAMELRDRDMRVIVVGGASLSPATSAGLPLASFTNAEEAHVRQRFHVDPDEFAVVLVGKDGGEKLRSGTPIPWRQLASTIDSMPMRQDEVRHRR